MASAPASDGFTLVELLVVLTILALVTAVAGPALGPALRRADEPQGPEQLKAELAAARRFAVRSGQVIRFEIEPVTGTFRTLAAGGERDSVVVSGAIEDWTPDVQGDREVFFYPSGVARRTKWTWPEGTDTAVITVEPLDGSITLAR